MVAETLKPCPFCGEHAAAAETHAAGRTFYGIDCLGCGAQVHESDPQRAALLWNTRPVPSPDVAVDWEVVARAAYNQGYRAGAEDSDGEPDMECALDGFHDWLASRPEFCAATRPASPSDVAPDEDWLAEVIDDSLDMDWTGRVGARAIIAAWKDRP